MDALTSNESGRYEIYAQPYPGPGSKVQISTEGGLEPAWSQHGREVFYRSGEKMMAVATRLEPQFSAAAPQVLFTGPYFFDPDPEFRQYYVTPDGREFVMLRDRGTRDYAASEHHRGLAFGPRAPPGGAG